MITERKREREIIKVISLCCILFFYKYFSVHVLFIIKINLSLDWLVGLVVLLDGLKRLLKNTSCVN